MEKPATRVPSVNIAFRTFGRTLRHGYENLGTLGVIGVFWYIGAALIVTLGPATAALHRITQPMSEERAASWRSFTDHFRKDWGWSSLLVWLLVGVLFILDVNRQFYAAATSAYVGLLSVFFLMVELIWFFITLFAMVLALRQQEDKRLRTTLRNTAVVVLGNLPGIFVSMILLTITSVILLILPPLFLLVPGWIALWTEENARLLLVAAGHLPEDEFADRPFHFTMPRRTPKKNR